jgi:UDP-N-acetylmuramoyl-tripeptide--D-alanyl-D-alanine ligase
MSDQPLWSVETMALAMGAERFGRLPAPVTGLSIDSRTIARGEAFFAIGGEHRDGHAFVSQALAAGGSLAVVAADKRAGFSGQAPLLAVPDVLAALYDLSRAARARSSARVIAVTGSVGKTGTKEMLRLALSGSGETHASVASYNNHWGVPLSLARCPQTARYAVFEIGMNHAGEIAPLTALARPHVAIITAIEPVHLEFFASLDAIADAKAEIFRGVEPGGVAVLNRDNPQFERLRRQAEGAGVDRIVSFGADRDADARLIDCVLRSDGASVEARILGTVLSYRLGAPGRHLVLNSLAVLAAAALTGADPALAASALAEFRPPAGRGARIMLETGSGSALLIDESYNANPASMRAAIALLGQAERGRRIAVLGDMLELGPRGADLHRELGQSVLAHGIDLVFCCGPLMHALWEVLPAERRGSYAETSTLLEPQVVAAVRAHDTVMVKGSLGSRMGPIARALERRYSRARARSDDVHAQS